MWFLTPSICRSLPRLEPQKTEGDKARSQSAQDRMKKVVMRRDPFGSDTCFLLEISPTQSRGEQSRTPCPVGHTMGEEQGWLGDRAQQVVLQ